LSESEDIFGFFELLAIPMCGVYGCAEGAFSGKKKTEETVKEKQKEKKKEKEEVLKR